MSDYQFWVLIAAFFIYVWMIDRRLKSIEGWLSFLARRGTVAE